MRREGGTHRGRGWGTGSPGQQAVRDRVEMPATLAGHWREIVKSEGSAREEAVTTDKEQGGQRWKAGGACQNKMGATQQRATGRMVLTAQA
jgi:hypothetical protein